MSALIEDRSTLVCACAFDLLQYVVLIEISVQNAASDRNMGGKGK